MCVCVCMCVCVRACMPVQVRRQAVKCNYATLCLQVSHQTVLAIWLSKSILFDYYLNSLCTHHITIQLANAVYIHAQLHSTAMNNHIQFTSSFLACVLIGSDDDNSNGASDAAIFGYIMLILLLSVIVLCLLVFVVKVKCKNR